MDTLTEQRAAKRKAGAVRVHGEIWINVVLPNRMLCKVQVGFADLTIDEAVEEAVAALDLRMREAIDSGDQP